MAVLSSSVEAIFGDATRCPGRRALSLNLDNPKSLNDMENEPAYKRRNVALENVSEQKGCLAVMASSLEWLLLLGILLWQWSEENGPKEKSNFKTWIHCICVQPKLAVGLGWPWISQEFGFQVPLKKLWVHQLGFDLELMSPKL